MPFDEGVAQTVETETAIPARRRRHRLLGGAGRLLWSHRLRPWTHTLAAYVTALAGAIFAACAWLVPETIASAALGWAGRCSWLFRCGCAALRAGLLRGGVGHAIAFYWVFTTVSVFGGFGVLVSGLIFGVFVATGGAHLPGFLVRLSQPTRFCRHGCAAHAGRHGTCRIGDTTALSLALRPYPDRAAAVRAARRARRSDPGFVRAVLGGRGGGAGVGVSRARPGLLLPLVALGLSLGYGTEVIDAHQRRHDREQEVIVVQGNGSLAEMKGIDSIEGVLRRTFELTMKEAKPGALIVWPEGSIPAYFPTDMGSAERTNRCRTWVTARRY